MRITSGLIPIAGAALIAMLSACGTSTDTSGSAAGTSTSQTSPSSSTAMSTAGSTASASPSAAMAAVITIKDFKYAVPASVAPGAKVTIKNEDGENHTVTSALNGAFTVQANADGTGSFTAPAKPGTYPFTCTFHANMMGKLVVK